MSISTASVVNDKSLAAQEVMDDPKLIVIAGGFYYFGDLVSVEDGFVTIKNFAMSGGYSGGKGIAGVCRGDSDAEITLDRFAKDEKGVFPIESCYGVLPCINLYQFKGTTLR